MPDNDTTQPIGSVFGYERLVRRPVAIAIEGPGKQRLYLGSRVVLQGDSRGYVPGGFEDGDEGMIVALLSPDEHGSGDHIVMVEGARGRGRVKPWNIGRVLSLPPAELLGEHPLAYLVGADSGTGSP